ncbi:MAG: hypothetical protein WBP72_14670 [Rhodocyclaceae bacterium]
MTKYSLLAGAVFLALVFAAPAHARRGDDGPMGWMFDRDRREVQIDRRDDRQQRREERRRQELSPEERRDLRRDIRDFGRDFERQDSRRRFRDR